MKEAGCWRMAETMAQQGRLRWMAGYLLHDPACAYVIAGNSDEMALPEDEEELKLFVRALVNVREPLEPSAEFLSVQDAYLAERLRGLHVTQLDEISFDDEGLAVWQGNITTLAADAIVNAANSQMLGCFVPNHRCIDNAIQTYAGVELRLACAELMERQGHEEGVGRAKITPGFNLPARYVLHTVGPMLPTGIPTARDRWSLRSCYTSCLELALEQGLGSVAFCCISTGEFRYPHKEAAEIAVDAVRKFKSDHAEAAQMKVIFNVFKDEDRDIYERLLAGKKSR